MADFLFWLIIGYGLRYSWEIITGKIEIANQYVNRICLRQYAIDDV